MTVQSFRQLIWRYYRAHGRHDLPWRQTTDVYRILVSEVMLQQTQVDRVIPYYRFFLRQFPTAKKLASAPLSEVLRAWQGLGYNRRAKMLWQAANALCVGKSDFPKTVEELEKLPGVGPYTARAVAAFAWNSDEIVIETNIRTVIIHHFFSQSLTRVRAGRYLTSVEKVSDVEIGEVLNAMLPRGRAREWYSALMDYGAHLKRSGVSHTARSSQHVRQQKFKGSLREARGAIVRALTKGSESERHLLKLLGKNRESDMQTALAALVREQLIEKQKTRYVLASGNRE